MSDVKWIKLNVNMPDNRKIKRIRRLPDGNNVVLFWVFLLTKAGESNQNGGLFFLEEMPYTVDDLAEEFDFTHDFVNFALATLRKMQMIEIYEDIIYIKNWEKYQSSDKLERIREQTRKRVAKHRKKTNKVGRGQNVTLHVTQCNAGEEELELDKELDKEKENYSEKIKSLFPVFSQIDNFVDLNKQYWGVIKETRKTGKIADSVIYNNMNKWRRYDPVVVEHALKEHINHHAGKREEYTIGIMRNTSKEEAENRLLQPPKQKKGEIDIEQFNLDD